ncbi:MAG: hypothetical protein KF878_23555 [Planctomycetes bacterium]|nr:hypothetical protein [Planctomycetota bacterium]
MSYRCAISGRVIPPGQPAVRVVLAVRPVTHAPRPGACRRRVTRKWRRVDDPGGEGYQIAREVLVSPEVARELATSQPSVLPARHVRRRTRQEEIEEALYGREAPLAYDAKGRRRPPPARHDD